MEIFLSSTCYDLEDLRAVLERDLRAAGHKVLLSDRLNFPVDPSRHRHDVCVERARDANLMILVVDRRRGAPFHSDPSISVTQAEFRNATKVPIPVYAFIRRSVFDERETWKSNPTLNPVHAKDVDVFKFISEIQSHPSGVWINKFDDVTHITGAIAAMEPFGGQRRHELLLRQGRATIESFSRLTQRYLRNVLGAQITEDAVSKSQLMKALDHSPLGSALHPMIWSQRSMHQTEFFDVVPIRPADDDGSSWFVVSQRTEAAATACSEIAKVIQLLPDETGPTEPPRLD